MAKTITTEIFFEAMRLLSALEIKNDIKDLVKEQTEGKKKDEFTFGYDLIMRVVDKAVQVKSEKNIYQFLAKVLEKTPEEIKDQNVITLIDDIIAVADLGEWKALFTRVASLIMQK